jgi:hypothetical protein
MRRFIMCTLICGLLSVCLQTARTNPLLAAADDDPGVLQDDRAFGQAVANADKAAMVKLLDAEFTWTGAAGRTQTRTHFLTDPPKPGIIW